MESELPGPELFRPSKRRKYFRKRGEAEAGDDETATTTKDATAPVIAPELMTVDELISQGGDGPSSVHAASEDAGLSIQDVIRLRKAAQRRKGGIEFRNNSTASPAPEMGEQLIAKEDTEEDIPEDIKNVISRFAPQTGQVTDDNDKHMYVYPYFPFSPMTLWIQRLT